MSDVSIDKKSSVNFKSLMLNVIGFYAFVENMHKVEFGNEK